MKKIIRILSLLSIAWILAITTSKAQEIVIGVRPHHEFVRRPMRPSHGHVWVAEEWTPAGGRYEYKAGYWAVPPRPGTVWIAGHWRHRPGGYVWVPGHWR